MLREEFFKEMAMPYEELVSYLIKKYGPAEYDYFCNKSCKTVNKKVKRTAEGLICHHVREDVGVNLNSAYQGGLQPWDWQRKENLVYCNWIEHLILHIKIAVFRQRAELKEQYDIRYFFTSGGVFMICSDINDAFMLDGTTIAWRQRCYQEIRDNYQEYILLLKAVIRYIDENYEGDKSGQEVLRSGGILEFSDGACEVVSVDKKRKRVIIRKEDGSIHDCSTIWLCRTYADRIDMLMQDMSVGKDPFYESIYNDIKATKFENGDVTELSRLMAVDFHGWGFPQFSGRKLDKQRYGASNLDEYIAVALPSSFGRTVNANAQVFFWNGDYVPQEAWEQSRYYIIRFAAVFNLKPGEEPFVYYRSDSDIMRIPLTIGEGPTAFQRRKRSVLLTTSDVYSRKDGKYYSEYIDLEGYIRKAKVVLTLGKDDFEIFRVRYIIKEFEILDGCYFIED